MPSTDHVGAAALVGLALLVGCMPEIVRSPASFRRSPPEDSSALVIAAPVEVGGVEGFKEELASGSTWKRVGMVEQGDVYRRTDGIFMLTSRNAHEAYLVVSDGHLVGFYLPGENAFAPASRPVALAPP